MKFLYYILCLVCCTLLFSSCKMADENGDLDGMWQLTEWRDKATNQVIKTNANGLYYSFQKKVMMFQQAPQESHYLSHFTHTGNELVVGKTIFWPDETERPLTELTAKFGVPADGRFHIDVLTSTRMQLSTDAHVLQFRKY